MQTAEANGLAANVVPTPKTFPVPRWRDSARMIAPLAWPVFVGQISVVAFSTIDTLLVARQSTADLAALAVGGAAYITVFLGLMGVVIAIAPISGQLFGANKLAAAGHQLHQAVWLAIALSLLGSTVLVFPEPFLALSQATPTVAAKARSYLLALAFALPASLMFAAFRGFNTAVSRPKSVMTLQLAGLGMKIPLSIALVTGIPALGVPSLGVVGCGIATAIALWAQLTAACWLLRNDRFYAPFHTPLAKGRRALQPPDRQAMLTQLKLGVPMGLTILIEVTGFSFMALFIARLGTDAVAGHQIAANLVALMFMMPLALGNATGTLVAQRIGAADMLAARRIGWHGVRIGMAIAALMGLAIFFGRHRILQLYTDNPRVITAALPLLTWVAAFHFADAAQGVAAFVLRAWRIAAAPLFIFIFALWGVGLGGGYLLAFDPWNWVPATLHGARGFWIASTCGLAVAAVGLAALMAWVLRQRISVRAPAAR